MDSENPKESLDDIVADAVAAHYKPQLDAAYNKGFLAGRSWGQQQVLAAVTARAEESKRLAGE